MERPGGTPQVLAAAVTHWAGLSVLHFVDQTLEHRHQATPAVSKDKQ